MNGKTANRSKVIVALGFVSPEAVGYIRFSTNWSPLIPTTSRSYDGIIRSRGALPQLDDENFPFPVDNSRMT
jgi:hypothetical protein